MDSLPLLLVFCFTAVLLLSLALFGRAETKFNRPLVSIELEVGVETLSRFGGHSLHIDALALRQVLLLLFAQFYALDFIGDTNLVGTLVR